MEHKVKIEHYNEKHRKQIISVWEKSVRATHDFIKPEDIDYYKQIVEEIDFNLFSVFCLVNEEKVVGFIGVLDFKVEMMFLDPDIIGQGFGKMLMNFALDQLKVKTVEVNEQNINAVKFYSKSGFVVYDRSEKDSEGKDYPILKMKI